MWKLFRSRGLIAKALKLAVKQLEDKPGKEVENTVQELAKQLGWTHVVRYGTESSLNYITFQMQGVGVWQTGKVPCRLPTILGLNYTSSDSLGCINFVT